MRSWCRWPPVVLVAVLTMAAVIVAFSGCGDDQPFAVAPAPHQAVPAISDTTHAPCDTTRHHDHGHYGEDR